jgi:hypothetical protein
MRSSSKTRKWRRLKENESIEISYLPSGIDELP